MYYHSTKAQLLLGNKRNRHWKLVEHNGTLHLRKATPESTIKPSSGEYVFLNDVELYQEVVRRISESQAI
jgi:hypothetical protein